MRPASSFTANERDVISERRHGWEQASCALLAKVFDTSPQVIASISKVSPAAPSRSHAGDRPNDDASTPSPLANPASSLPGRPVNPHPTEGGPALSFNVQRSAHAHADTSQVQRNHAF